MFVVKSLLKGKLAVSHFGIVLVMVGHKNQHWHKVMAHRTTSVTLQRRHHMISNRGAACFKV